jgi:hypothetical protein
MAGHGVDIAFARDGASLALALSGGTVEIHDATTGALVRTIAAEKGFDGGAVHVVGLPAQDAWWVARNEYTRKHVRCEVLVISARDGTCLRSFTVPYVQALAVSPDGARIAAACDDGTIWIWRTSLPFAFGR